MGGAVAALTGASFYLLWLLSFVVIVVGAVVGAVVAAAAVCSFVLFMFFLAGAHISLTNCYFMNNTVTSTSGQAGGKVTLEGQPLLPHHLTMLFLMRRTVHFSSLVRFVVKRVTGLYQADSVAPLKILGTSFFANGEKLTTNGMSSISFFLDVLFFCDVSQLLLLPLLPLLLCVLANFSC